MSGTQPFHGDDPWLSKKQKGGRANVVSPRDLIFAPCLVMSYDCIP